MHDFYEMNNVFEGIFRVLLIGKYFGGFSVGGKVFLWVVQKYRTPLIPVCRFVKSTPWDWNLFVVNDLFKFLQLV